MPISSGANGWPTSHWAKPPPRQPPPPPPPPVVVLERAPPRVDSDTGRKKPSWPAVRREPHPEPPRQPRREYPKSSDCCCHCGGDPFYTTGIAGAGAGCCGGGMFGSRKYPFGGDEEYKLKGTGRRRCCACIWALIIGLLLLALLLGLLLGLLPYLNGRNARNTVQQQLTGGYYRDGIYYYPITDSPDEYYFAVGPGIPCNPFNNKSDTSGNTVGYDLVTNSYGNETETVSVTDAPIVTLPNCNEISTAYVRVANFSVPQTTTTTVSTTTAASSVVRGSLLAVPFAIIVCAVN